MEDDGGGPGVGQAVDGDAGQQGAHPEEGPPPLPDQDPPGLGEQNTETLLQVIFIDNFAVLSFNE